MRWLLLLVLTPLLFFVSPVSASATYYIDSTNGKDTNAGNFPVQCGTTCGPWKTLARVNAKTSASCVTACAVPGDRYRFLAGGLWTGTTLDLGQSGTSTLPINIEKYGSGVDPTIMLANPCVSVSGSYNTIRWINTSYCGTGQPIGFSVAGDYNLLDRVTAQNNHMGIYIRGFADYNRLTGSTIKHNYQGDGTGSSGVGINLHGFQNELDHNTIQDNYWTDPTGCRHGSGIEIYGGNGEDASYNYIHHNLGINNEAFSELGTDVDPVTGVSLGSLLETRFLFNVVRGDLAPVNCGSATVCRDGLNGQVGIITRGDHETPNPVEYGPVEGTRIHNNTFYFTGACSQGIVCAGDCANPNEYLVIDVKNTVAVASWKGIFIGNVSGYSWPVNSAYESNLVDYNLFTETGPAEPGDAHCQFQGVSCPAMTHGLTHGDDPDFTDPANWDLRPYCGLSPLIDSGKSFAPNPDYATDFAGVTIPQGSGPDIGAYERICP